MMESLSLLMHCCQGQYTVLGEIRCPCYLLCLRAKPMGRGASSCPCILFPSQSHQMPPEASPGHMALAFIHIELKRSCRRCPGTGPPEALRLSQTSPLPRVTLPWEHMGTRGSGTATTSLWSQRQRPPEGAWEGKWR